MKILLDWVIVSVVALALAYGLIAIGYTLASIVAPISPCYSDVNIVGSLALLRECLQK